MNNKCPALTVDEKETILAGLGRPRSGFYLVEYAGAPVRFGFGTSHTVEIVQEWQADRFASEADAWWAAYQAGLSPNRCAVKTLAGE